MPTFNLADVVKRMSEKTDRSQAKRCLRHELQALGANELGSGAFGTVYQHPTDKTRVIKFSTDQDAYYMFMRWCMLAKNKGNPYLPVFYSEHVIRIDDRVAFVHEMEHLERPLTVEANDAGRSAPQEPKHVPNMIIGTFWKAGRVITSDNSVGWRRNGFATKFPTRLSFIKELKAIANKKHKREFGDWPTAVTIKEIRIAKKFIDLMYSMFTDFSGVANLDFHGGNIMLRPGKRFAQKRTGMIVITDPVSEIYSDFRHDVTTGNVTKAIDAWLEQVNKEQYINKPKRVTLRMTPAHDIQTFVPVANIAPYGNTNVSYNYATINAPQSNAVDMTQFFETTN